jgi:hypothetical protein
VPLELFIEAGAGTHILQFRNHLEGIALQI